MLTPGVLSVPTSRFRADVPANVPAATWDRPYVSQSQPRRPPEPRGKSAFAGMVPTSQRPHKPKGRWFKSGPRYHLQANGFLNLQEAVACCAASDLGDLHPGH
jgi:hypothetical protein